MNQFVAFFRQDKGDRHLPVRFPQDAAQLHDRPKIGRDSFDPMLMGQSIEQSGQIAGIVFKGRGGELNVSFEDGRIDIPSLHQLVDVLGREEIFVGLPVSFELKNGFIDLGFDGDFDIEIALGPGSCRQDGIPRRIPTGTTLGCLGASAAPLQDLYLALSAGGASSAGGIDMNPGLHGRLKEIGL